MLFVGDSASTDATGVILTVVVVVVVVVAVVVVILLILLSQDASSYSSQVGNILNYYLS